jgi:two-component system, OmpR family, response regulator MprA
MRVLAVDDDVELLSVYREMLAGRGHEVATATSGISGLKAIEEFSPDIILLDVTLPGLSGWDFLRMARLTSRGSDIPVVVVTGTPLRKSAAPASHLGADVCIAKPFSARELLLLVERMLGPSGSVPFHQPAPTATA